MPRATSTKRGYDSRWDKARRTFLSRPVNRDCRMCAELGRKTRATVVDHIIPHRGNQRLFWDTSNWQGLCATCHNGAKQSQERTGRVRGVGKDGVPLDPGHHWRAHG